MAAPMMRDAHNMFSSYLEVLQMYRHENKFIHCRFITVGYVHGITFVSTLSYILSCRDSAFELWYLYLTLLCHNIALYCNI